MIKGPIFPSFREPSNPRNTLVESQDPPQRSLQPGKIWLTHSGRQSRIRRLRQICRPLLNSKDLEIKDAIRRVSEISAEQGEYGMLIVLSTAKEIAESNNIEFIEAVHTMLDKVVESIAKESEPIV
jgi:hypothetical protein